MSLELFLASELLALTALTFSRPVLEGFGEAPVVFESRRAATADVVWFGVLVTVLPVLVATAVGAAGGLAARASRREARQAVLVGVLAGAAAWRLTLEQTSWTGADVGPIGIGLVTAVAAGRLRLRPRTGEVTGRFLRFAGLASAAYLVNFLFLSDVARSDLPGDRQVDVTVAEEVAAGLPPDAPPVVFVLFDALPTATLLDGDGQLDADLFPAFARLAGDATWYRNHTTVSAFTNHAVPALLTGRYPDEAGRPNEPEDNVFTMLGAGYRMHTHEPVIHLCPRLLCPDAPSFAGQGTLLGDAVSFWRGGTAATDTTHWLPDATGPDRFEGAQEWIADVHDRLASQAGPSRPADGAGESDGPPFLFSHLMLPHSPWQLTDEGVVYETAGMPDYYGFNWLAWGSTVGRQAHVLQTQAADRLLGELLDDLREAGIYDEALIVVTADHGEAFLPHTSSRGVTEDGWHNILWTPLLVKEPGQEAGDVDDSNVQSVDVVPTITEALGIQAPWELDGVPVSEAARRRPEAGKPVVLGEFDPLREVHGEGWTSLDGDEGLARLLEESAVEATGPDAVWKRTAHGDLLRASVEDLDIGDPLDVHVELESPGGLDGIATSDPLPLEVLARTDLEPGTIVALALNGRVAAVVNVKQDGRSRRDWDGRIHALMVPDLFVEGDNELTVYRVDGSPGDETLRPASQHM